MESIIEQKIMEIVRSAKAKEAEEKKKEDAHTDFLAAYSDQIFVALGLGDRFKIATNMSMGDNIRCFFSVVHKSDRGEIEIECCSRNSIYYENGWKMRSAYKPFAISVHPSEPEKTKHATDARTSVDILAAAFASAYLGIPTHE